MLTAKCIWCETPLVFLRGKGWVHIDDYETVRTRFSADGEVRDDHVALPDAESLARGRNG